MENKFVAFVDMLGTKIKLGKSVLDEGEGYLTAADDLATTWKFMCHLCKIFPDVYVYGGSDSFFIFADKQEDILKYIIALFQITAGVRRFPIRAGIEFGEVFKPDEFQRSIYGIQNKLEVSNIVIPRYLSGSGIIGAVEAEGKLKGSRISIGKKLIKKLSQENPAEFRKLVIERKQEGIGEVNWCVENFTDEIFIKLNQLEAYEKPSRDSFERYFRWFREPHPELKDEYVKAMIGLGVELDFLKVI